MLSSTFSKGNKQCILTKKAAISTIERGINLKKRIKVKKQESGLYSVEEVCKLLFMYEYQNGTSRSVGQAIGWSKTKTAELYRKCKEVGLTYEDAKSMSSPELNRILGTENDGAENKYEVSDDYWEWVCRELHQHNVQAIKPGRKTQCTRRWSSLRGRR